MSEKHEGGSQRSEQAQGQRPEKRDASSDEPQGPLMPRVSFARDRIPVQLRVPDPQRAPQWHKRYGDLPPPPAGSEVEAELKREGVEPYPTKVVTVGQVDTRLVQAASAGDLAAFGQAAKTCGQCAHFSRRGFDSEVLPQLIATLRAAQLRGHYLASSPKELGRCGMDDGLLVGIHSKACDQFKERR